MTWHKSTLYSDQAIKTEVPIMDVDGVSLSRAQSNMGSKILRISAVGMAR